MWTGGSLVKLSSYMKTLVDWYRYKVPLVNTFGARYIMWLRGQDIVRQRKAERRCGKFG